MTTRTRTLAAGLIALSLAVITTSSVKANVDFLAADGTAHLSAGNTVAVVTGSVLCTAGDTLSVSAVIVQTRGKANITGSGLVSGLTCLGVAQTFAVPVDILIPLNGAFKKGPASAIIGVSTNDGMGGFDNLTDAVSIHISQ
jgi:hypothetical protein